MSDVRTLLPPNAGRVVRALEQTQARIENVPIPIRLLVRPSECPAELLPYLAWSESVDYWSDEWDEARQRAVIAAAYIAHRNKGTRSALRAVVESLGYTIEFLEWWEDGSPDDPHEWRAYVDIPDGITVQGQRTLLRLIEATKPLRSHLVELQIANPTQTVGLGVAAVPHDGDYTSFALDYPPS